MESSLTVSNPDRKINFFLRFENLQPGESLFVCLHQMEVFPRLSSSSSTSKEEQQCSGSLMEIAAGTDWFYCFPSH